MSRAVAVDAHDDDGCPICVAARGNGEGDVLSFFPGPDGSAPALPEAVLISAARKAIAEQKPTLNEAISFIEYGSRAADGGIVSSSFAVDGAGRIFWISPRERRLVLEIPS